MELFKLELTIKATKQPAHLCTEITLQRQVNIYKQNEKQEPTEMVAY